MPFARKWLKSSLEKLSEKSRRYLQHNPTDCQRGPFGPFLPPRTGQIHARSVAQTPFRTVSKAHFPEVHIHDPA